MGYQIAVDGPSGAGKSSLAKALAQEFSFLYVDTGALYRAIGLYCLRKGIDTKQSQQVIAQLDEIQVELRRIDGVQHVYLNGEDVSEQIRTPAGAAAASDVSAVAKVRQFLLDLQRSVAKTHNVIMDGRDIGTVVLPDADVKLFLTAVPEVRARRRYEELLQKGKADSCSYDEILALIKQRDLQDSTRAIAPLKCAEDAQVLDNSEIDFDQTVQQAVKMIRSKIDV